MEVEEMEMQARKRWRIGNGREGVKIDDDDDDEEGGEDGLGGVDKEERGRILAQHSSRIFRIPRASGGKDRHSKVLTAKGLRDRRVRLSVSTAIQFYDLQDRLRYDQPSKAVEWLIKAAAKAIAKLPPLNGAFPMSPKEEEVSDDKLFDPDAETDQPTAYLQHQQMHSQQQPLSLSKSACSSTSETSKGSVMSRSEIRVKARERARERTAKEKEKEKENEKESNLPHHHNPNPNAQSSFTDLLTVCNDSASTTSIPTATTQTHNPNFIRHFPDYFSQSAIFGPAKTQHASAFSGQAYYGNPPLSGLPLHLSSAAANDHPELQQYAFLQDHLISVAAAANNNHNLNFPMSSSLTGFNRGTLQSNIPSSLLPHMQRFPTPMVDAPPNAPFFLGTPASGAAVENQFPTGFDGRLQLFYGDGCKHSDLKGKGKS